MRLTSIFSDLSAAESRKRLAQQIWRMNDPCTQCEVELTKLRHKSFLSKLFSNQITEIIWLLVWNVTTSSIIPFHWTVMCTYICGYDIIYFSGGSFGAGRAVTAAFYCVLGCVRRGYGSFSSYRQDLVMLCWPCTYPPTFTAMLTSDNYWLRFGPGRDARRAHLQTHSSHSGSRCQVGGLLDCSQMRSLKRFGQRKTAEEEGDSKVAYHGGSVWLELQSFSSAIWLFLVRGSSVKWHHRT